MNPVTLESVNTFLSMLFRASWQAAILAAMVYAVQLALGQRLSGKWRYNLWLIVVVRLLVLVIPSSPVSVFNYVPHSEVRVRTAPIEMMLPRSNAPSIVSLAGSLTKAEPTRTICWPCILFAIWTIGAMGLLVRVAWAWLALRRDIARCDKVNDEAILRLRDDCAAKLGIRSAPDLLIANNLPGPALTGVFHPKVLLPREVVENFDTHELRLILLHEFTHLRRRDVFANWVMTLAQIAHWFNPIIWLALAGCRADRELACDEAVLAMTETSHYGQTILKLIETSARGAVLPGVVGILERPHALRRRVTMIATFATRKQTWSVAAVAAMLAIGAAGLTDAVRGQNPPAPAAVPAAPAKPTAAPAAALTPPSAIAAAKSADDPQRDQLMDHVLPEVRFDAIGFSDVMDFLRDTTGANIVVNWKQFEVVGIDRNTPVTLRVKDVRFEKVMQLLADQLSVSGPKVKFEYADRVLMVSIEQSGSPGMTREVYDVDDLITSVLKKSPTTQPEVNVRQDIAGDLKSLIEEHVSPACWQDKGGDGGVIGEFNGKLVVTTTPANHEDIHRLLDDLRQGKAQASAK